ncbi:MAG: hypothetical protein D6806_08040 [Deltaproteobacteria bacterium]|nr:MAG: hypothetical protein D6806_08040 [Deltaproteobacteria bacterium]
MPVTKCIVTLLVLCLSSPVHCRRPANAARAQTETSARRRSRPTPSGGTLQELKRRVLKALERSTSFIASQQGLLRYEAAVAIRLAYASSGVEQLEKLLPLADRIAASDPDNPQRRFFSSEFEADRRSIQGWVPPERGRMNTNRPIIEALWCDRYPMRRDTLLYIGGNMRDGGSYGSTHALWALILARQKGCIDEQTFRRLSGPIVDELVSAQPRLCPAGATGLDIYAERALFLALAGYKKQHHHWLNQILKRQSADGGFGLPQGKNQYYVRIHATLVATWYMAEWLGIYGR